MGHLGSLHAKIYHKLEKCSLEGICDIDNSRLSEISGALNIPGFSDYRELFNKLEAVSIAVPTKLHYKIAKDFLEHNIHVLIEKPFTTSIEEADALIKLSQKNKLILQVGHIERFKSAFSATKKLIKDPKFI